jgi:hypothetical protein
MLNASRAPICAEETAKRAVGAAVPPRTGRRDGRRRPLDPDPSPDTDAATIALARSMPGRPVTDPPKLAKVCRLPSRTPSMAAFGRPEHQIPHLVSQHCSGRIRGSVPTGRRGVAPPPATRPGSVTNVPNCQGRGCGSP